MKVFIKKAAQYGAKVVSDKGKHLKFRDSLGHQISAPKTTSDWRAIKNFESELKGRGFVNQQTTKKVKDALVKGTKETALPASRKTANQQTTFKQFTQKFQPNVQGPRRSELEVQADNVIRSLRSKPARKKISRAELDGMNIPQKQKDALVRQGLVGEQLAQEQMVVPRGLKKKNPLMTPETEMELLKRLSNRKSFYDRARTGRPMPTFSEDNKHRDAKLNYQYKQVTDPKRPEDPIKRLKKGMV